MGRRSRNGVLVVLGVLAGCRSQGGDPTPGDPAVGVVQMPLVATAEGKTYRLRHATFAITGPQAATLDSETAPDAPSLTATLATGAYSIELQPGWSLERLDAGGAVVVAATLTSPNPTTFTIATAATTAVSYQFATDGTVVTFDRGTLEVTIGVAVNHDGGAGADAATPDAGATDAAGPTTVPLSDIAAGNGGFAINGDGNNNITFVPVGVGDVNGDGLDDVVIGAPFAGLAGFQSGASYVVFGKRGGGPVSLADVAAGVGGFVITGLQAGDFAGILLSGVGDVNGDGLDDILIASNTRGATNAMLATVVFGKADGAPVSLDNAAAGQGGFAIVGEPSNTVTSIDAVSAAGDVNGDGLDDLLVGSSILDDNFVATNRAYVVFGKTDTAVVRLADVTAGIGDGFAIDSEGQQQGFASTLGAAGDVNGDGLDDVILGAPSHDVGIGRAYVVFGKADNARVDTSTLVTSGRGQFIDGETFATQFGSAVAGAGDVNGDGVPDLLVTGQTFRDESGFEQFPRTYVVFGVRAAANLRAADVASGVGGFIVDAPGGVSQTQARAAGDVDGDGLDDVVIGTFATFQINHPTYTFGRVHVLYGKRDTTPAQLGDLDLGRGGFSLRGADARPGESWASRGDAAGDVDGDGFADVVLSAAKSSDGAVGYVVHGGDFGARASATGGDGDDTLVASHGAGRDLLVGGAGNDRLVSDGGDDVLLGGSGDDRLVVTGGFPLRADGGGGHDTLAVGSAAMSLALEQVPIGRLRSIEAVDLAGFGANTVSLDLPHARTMPHATHTLTITGDAEDTVVLRYGNASVQVVSGGGATSYTVGHVTVRVVGGAAVHIE